MRRRFVFLNHVIMRKKSITTASRRRHVIIYFLAFFCVLSRRFSSFFVSDVSQKSSLFFCVPTPLSRESFRTKGIILVFVVKPVHVRFFSSRFFLSDHFQVLVNTYGNVAAIYRRCPPPVLPSTPCIKVLLSWGGLVLDYNYGVCG